MNFTSFGVIAYCSSVAGLGLVVNQFQFKQSLAVSNEGKDVARYLKELEALDDAERDRYWYWRLGAFSLGLSLVNFVAVGAALLLDENTTVCRAVFGGVLGAFPTTLFGLYYIKNSADEINSIKRQRLEFLGEKISKGLKIKKIKNG